MQNAGQFGPGAASVHPPSSQFIQSEPSPNGGSTTSSLRQFRKKDVEKNVDQPPIKQMSESHVARVAPHNHYPPVANDVYRYSGHQFSGYSPGQVKYSDLAETSQPNPISTSVIQKPKTKEYMEMCNVQSQQHLNSHPQYSPDNGQYMHKDPAQSYPSGFKPTESHFFPKDQHQYQQMNHHPVPSKYNNPMIAQNMRKYNPAPADNPFLDKLSKIHPSMARSIISDHHLQNAQSGYPPMDQRGMYGQQNHRYYAGTIHQPNPYSPNPNYPINSYPNYQTSSCSYPRSSQMSPVVSRYPPLERSLSPSRRAYPDTMHMPHMNYHTMHQKISSGPNFSTQYSRTPEYAQHYQHRRMPQDYFPQVCRSSQYMQSHHQLTGQEMQEMQETTVSPSDSIKKFIETWGDADEEPSAEINPLDPNLRDKLRDDAPGTVYMINPNDLQYFENNGIPIVTSDNGNIHMTSENYQNLLKNSLVDNTAIVRIIEPNKDNPSDNQDRVVHLQIMESPKSDCMLANKQSNPCQNNSEDANRRVVIHQNTIINPSGNDKSNPDQNMPLVENNNSITKELVDKNCSPINLDHLEHNLGFREPSETENGKNSNVSNEDLSLLIDKSPEANKSMPIIDFFGEAITENQLEGGDSNAKNNETESDDIKEENADKDNQNLTEKNDATNFNTVIVAPDIKTESITNNEEAIKSEPNGDSPSEPDRRKRIFSVDDIIHNIGNNSRRSSDVTCSYQTINEFIEKEIAFSSLEQLRCHFYLMKMRANSKSTDKIPEISTRSNILRVEASSTLLELAGQLMEISVNIVNGRKVINVTPLSDTTAFVDVNDNYQASANEESNPSEESSKHVNEAIMELMVENIENANQLMDLEDSSKPIKNISNELSEQISTVENEAMEVSDVIEASSTSPVNISENVENNKKNIDLPVEKSFKKYEAFVKNLSMENPLAEELNEKSENSKTLENSKVDTPEISNDSNPDLTKSTISGEEGIETNSEIKELKEEIFEENLEEVKFSGDIVANESTSVNFKKTEKETEKLETENVFMKETPTKVIAENECQEVIEECRKAELKTKEICQYAVNSENFEESTDIEVKTDSFGEIQDSIDIEISQEVTLNENPERDEWKADTLREECLLESTKTDNIDEDSKELEMNSFKNYGFKQKEITLNLKVPTKEIKTEFISKSIENVDDEIENIPNELSESTNNNKIELDATVDSSKETQEFHTVAEITESDEETLTKSIVGISSDSLPGENQDQIIHVPEEHQNLLETQYSEEFVELEVTTLTQTDEVFASPINCEDHESLETTSLDFPLEDEVFISDPPAHEVIVADPLEGIGIVDEISVLSDSPQIPLEPVTTTEDIVKESTGTDNEEEIVKVVESEIQILSPTSTNIDDSSILSESMLQRKYSTDNDISEYPVCVVVTKAAKKSYESDLQVQHDIVSSSKKEKRKIKKPEIKKSKRLNEKVLVKNEQKEKFRLLKEKRKRKEKLRQKSIKPDIIVSEVKVEREEDIKIKQKVSDIAKVVEIKEKSLLTEGDKKRRKSEEELRQKSLYKDEVKEITAPELVIQLEQVNATKENSLKKEEKEEKIKNKNNLEHDEDEYVDFKELLKARKLKKMKKLQEAKAKEEPKKKIQNIKQSSNENLLKEKKFDKLNICRLGSYSSSNNKKDEVLKNKSNMNTTKLIHTDKKQEIPKVDDLRNPPIIDNDKKQEIPKVDDLRNSPIINTEKIIPQKENSFSENTISTPVESRIPMPEIHPKDPRRKSKAFGNQVLAPSVSELIEENSGGASKKKISLADYVSRKRKASFTDIKQEKRPKLDSIGYERSESIESNFINNNNNISEESANRTVIKEKSLSDIKTSFLIHSSDWENSNSPPPAPEPEECLIEDFSGLIKNNNSKKPVIDVNELTLLENPKDKKLQEYKDKVDSQLSSLNIQIPKSKPLNRSPKGDNLVQRFLNNEKLTQNEMEEIRKLVSYKKAMQHQKNGRSPSKSPRGDRNFTNILKSPASTSSDSAYEIKSYSTLETRLHLKKVNSKRKFVSEEDKEEGSGSVIESPKKSYSVFNRLGEDGLPKIIFKRNIKCNQTKEPIVQLVKLNLDDMETVKRKYNVTVRQMM